MSRSHGACPHLQQLYYHAVFAVSSPSSHGANGERRVAARIPRMRKCLRVHVFLPVGVVSLSVSCACHISPESSLENESALCDGTDGERARAGRGRRATAAPTTDQREWYDFLSSKSYKISRNANQRTQPSHTSPSRTAAAFRARCVRGVRGGARGVEVRRDPSASKFPLRGRGRSDPVRAQRVLRARDTERVESGKEAAWEAAWRLNTTLPWQKIWRINHLHFRTDTRSERGNSTQGSHVSIPR